jgi:hypothetical protein
MIISRIWSGICRCGRGLTILGLGTWMPVCECCEMLHRAEPAPPPPAVVVERPAQFHYDAEMAVQPTVLQPTAAASGAIQNAYAWTLPVNATAPSPENTLVLTSNGMCWSYRLQPQPVFLSGGVIHSMTPEPFWPTFHSGRAYC